MPKRFVFPKILLVMTVLTVLLYTPATSSEKEKQFTEKERAYWAFQKVKRASPPQVEHSDWVRNPIDAFILRPLEQKGISPGPEADRVTLLRRVSFDLVGLPPTPEETQAFLTDKSPDAYEKLVERLLASPHYGERWGRHWLDVARYAESDGFRADEPRPNVWRYRDYVVRSFNDDKGYDRFMREQIAGDELWPENPQARIATAFSRHYSDEWNARNLMQRRQEILQDITDAVGSAFLGLTVGCAKCHDHKFDPILQRDYYRLQAFFAATANDDKIPAMTPEEIAEERSKSQEWEAATREIRTEMRSLLQECRNEVTRDEFFKFPDLIKDSVAKDPAKRTPYEEQMAHRAKVISEPSDFMAMGRMKGERKKRYEELQTSLKQFDHLYHREIPMGSGMRDLSPVAPPTHVLEVANYERQGAEVEPGFLTILDPAPAKVVQPADHESTGRRTALANWLADPNNPLTARVMVNRIWYHHFGVGIVPTPGDFGRMGQRSTNPELLDWLASEFVQNGWSIKYMHRLMVTSSAYRQTSAFRQEASKLDPMNRLLWRFRPQRIEAEAIRDSALAVSGLLNPALGGPSVHPGLPAGMPPPAGGWKISSLEEQHRRSLYIAVRRTASFPMMSAFDMPETHESCARRGQTITAPQALVLLNSDQSLEWAQAFAGRVIERAGNDPRTQVQEVFTLAYSRPPDAWETDRLLTFFHQQEAVIGKRKENGDPIAQPTSSNKSLSSSLESAALVDLCLAVLNSNEFVYRF